MRDQLAMILMVAGVVFVTVGVLIAVSVSAALVTLGLLLIFLALLLGWRTD